MCTRSIHYFPHSLVCKASLRTRVLLKHTRKAAYRCVHAELTLTSDSPRCRGGCPRRAPCTPIALRAAASSPRRQAGGRVRRGHRAAARASRDPRNPLPSHKHDAVTNQCGQTAQPPGDAQCNMIKETKISIVVISRLWNFRRCLLLHAVLGFIHFLK